MSFRNSRLTVAEDLSSIVTIQHQCVYSSRKVRSSFVRPFDVGNGPQISEWIRSSMRETLLVDGTNGLRICFARMQTRQLVESCGDLMYESLRSVVVEAWNEDA